MSERLFNVFFLCDFKTFCDAASTPQSEKNTHSGKNVNLHARSQSLHLAVMAALERFRLFVRSCSASLNFSDSILLRTSQD